MRLPLANRAEKIRIGDFSQVNSQSFGAENEGEVRQGRLWLQLALRGMHKREGMLWEVFQERKS